MCKSCGANVDEPHREGCEVFEEELSKMDDETRERVLRNWRINLDRFYQGLPVPYSAYE